MSNPTVIVSTIYNNAPLVADCIEGVLKTAIEPYVYVLVDNHSLDSNVTPLIQYYAREYNQIKIVDPGKNIGCHFGFDYGWKHSGVKYQKYVVKLDDDTVMLTEGWNLMMQRALDAERKLGFLSTNIDAKQGEDFIEKSVAGMTVEVPKVGVSGFSCVMFKGYLLRRFGGVSMQQSSGSLYGGEEHHFWEAAKKIGYWGGYLKESMAHHADNEERDVDYVLWKVAYGAFRLTNMPLRQFKQNPKMMQICYQSIIQRFGEEHAWGKMAKQRIEELTNA